jgi:hypothetical protein
MPKIVKASGILARKGLAKSLSKFDSITLQTMPNRVYSYKDVDMLMASKTISLVFCHKQKLPVLLRQSYI